MRRHNCYTAQIVSEAEVDEWFDDAEDAERDCMLEAKVAQGLVAGSPSADVYGGIVNGLTLSGVGTDTLTIATGQARDQLGRRINLPAGGATLDITKTGDTTIAAVTAAIGDGALITGTCGAGQHIVATVSIVFAQDTDDPRVDGLGNTVYYDLDESFYFNIRINAAFNDANVIASAANPSRIGLLDGHVCLADLLLQNVAGTLTIAAIMETSINWRSRGGNYATFNGRRSSWLAIETEDEYDSADAGADIVRANSAREAIYITARKQASDVIISHRDRAAPTIMRRRNMYGIPNRAHEFFDDFPMVAGEVDVSNPALGYFPNWTVAPITGVLGVLVPDNYVIPTTSNLYGGSIRLIGKNALPVEGVEIYTTPQWHLGDAPYAISMWRFQIPAGNTGYSRFGFRGQGGTSYAYLRWTGPGADLTLSCCGSTGVAGAAQAVGTITLGSWHTARIMVRNNERVYAQLDNNAWVAAVVAAGDSFDIEPYQLRACTTGNAGTGLQGILYLDQAYAADSELATDMK